MLEKDLIAHFFDRSHLSEEVVCGIGDDAALITLPAQHLLATSIDTLVDGVNFPHNTSPEDIGYKAIAVSLSDMAAMGADPKTALLSLTMPQVEEKWLRAFSTGLFELIYEFNMQLIGGDITKGPLSVTTVVNGFVPQGQAILRSNANVGDQVYVTGFFGDAGLALSNNPDSDCLRQLNRPTPRVSVGIALRNIASAAIDISDGLATDLEKLCVASNVGASIAVNNVPRNKAPIETALTAGDDFELCFTVPSHKEQELTNLKLNVPIKKIGHITAEKTVHYLLPNGTKMELAQKGYEHF